VVGLGSSTSPVFEVVRPAAFFARVGRDRKIGLRRLLRRGRLATGNGTDLAELLTVFASG
jgi:cyclopropane-fatty-acyl-phospholipid synthase